MKVKDATVIQNKFAGKCRCCGKRVGAYEGIAMTFGSGWTTAHFECEPEFSAPLVADLRKRQEELEAKETAQAKALADAKEAWEALVSKLGIDFKTEVDSVAQQHAWNDYYEWSCPFTGDGTDEEFAKALRTPAQSSYGKLRWSNGRNLVSVDRVNKLVRMSESISLCD